MFKKVDVKNNIKSNTIKNDIETNTINIIKADELKKETDINHNNKNNEGKKIKNIKAKKQFDMIMSILNDLVKSKYAYNNICLISNDYFYSNVLLDETIKLLEDIGYNISRYTYFYHRLYYNEENDKNDICKYDGNIYLLSDYTQKNKNYFNRTSYSYYKISW